MSSLLDNYAVDEHELLASICQENYYEFFKEFNSLFIQEEMVYNWHLEYLCNEIQEVAERVIAGKKSEYDLIVNVPPGMTKSSIFSIAFTPWLWSRFPRGRVLCVSHTDLLCQDLSTKSRDMILSEKYQRTFPHIQLKDDQNTKTKWDNNYGGWRLSCTVAGRTPTGFHAHVLMVDDPIDPLQAKSQLAIKTASDWMRHVLPTRKVNKDRVPTILVMQRLDVDDPSGDRLRNTAAGPVKHIRLPCDDTWPISPKALIRRYRKQNGLLDPIRLNRETLKKEEAQSNFAYAGQYGQEPLPKGGIIFDVEQLQSRISRSPPDKFKRTVRYWDKAYSQNSGAYTVGVKIGQTLENPARFWVLDVVRFQKEAAQREAIIKATARADGLGVKIGVEQEPAAGKESVQNTIRNLAGFRVYADRRGGVNDANKVMRADPFASQVNAGNVFMVEAPWNKDYIEELRYFSEKAKYKDQVDASSGAFSLIVKVMTIGAMK